MTLHEGKRVLKDSSGQLYKVDPAEADRTAKANGWVDASDADVSRRVQEKEEVARYGTTQQQALGVAEKVFRTATAGLVPDDPGAVERARVLDQESPILSLGSQVAGTALGAYVLKGAAAAAGAGAEVAALAEGIGGAYLDEAEAAKVENREISPGNVVMFGLGGELLGRGVPALIRRGMKSVRPLATAAEAVAGEAVEDLAKGAEKTALERAGALAAGMPDGPAKAAAIKMTAEQQAERAAVELAETIPAGTAAADEIDNAADDVLDDIIAPDAPAQTNWATSAAADLRSKADELESSLATPIDDLTDDVVETGEGFDVRGQEAAAKRVKDTVPVEWHKNEPIVEYDEAMSPGRTARSREAERLKRLAAEGEAPSADLGEAAPVSGTQSVDDLSRQFNELTGLTQSKEDIKAAIRERVKKRRAQTGSVSLGEAPGNVDYLKTKNSSATGATEGGMYTGSDGKQRYVKFMREPDALNEAATARAYEDLGIAHVQHTTAAGGDEGHLLLSDRLGPEWKPLHMHKGPVTKEMAHQYLEGVPADIVLGNVDRALNLGNIMTDGKRIVRIDAGIAGPTILDAPVMKSQTSVKGMWDELLEPVASGESVGLSDGPRALATEGGVKSMAAARKSLQDGVDRIKTAFEANGGVHNFVKERYPHLSTAEQRKFAVQLDQRLKAVSANVNKIARNVAENGYVTIGKKAAERGAPNFDIRGVLGGPLGNVALTGTGAVIGGQVDGREGMAVGAGAGLLASFLAGGRGGRLLRRVADSLLDSKGASQAFRAAKTGAQELRAAGAPEELISFLEKGLEDKSLWGRAAEMQSDLKRSGAKVASAKAIDASEDVLKKALKSKPGDRGDIGRGLQEAVEGLADKLDVASKWGLLPKSKLGKLAQLVLKGRKALGNADAASGGIAGEVIETGVDMAMSAMGVPPVAGLAYKVGKKLWNNVDDSAKLAIKESARQFARPLYDESLDSAKAILATTALARFQEDYPTPQASFEAKKKLLTDSNVDPLTVPMAISESLGSLAQSDPKLFTQVAARLQSQVAYVRANLPPGVAVSIIYPTGAPISQQALKDYATLWNTTFKPDTVLQDFARGKASPDQMRVLRDVHPDVYQNLQQETFFQVSTRFADIPSQRKKQLDILFQTDGLAGPAFSSQAASYIGEATEMYAARGPGNATPPVKPEQMAPPAASINAIQKGVTNRGA